MNPHQKLSEFLITWPYERLEKMSVEEYTGTGNHETFCYWSERETEILGRIGGKPSNKFMIWKKGNHTQTVDSKSYLSDERYKWRRSLGNTSEEAFETAKSLESFRYIATGFPSGSKNLGLVPSSLNRERLSKNSSCNPLIY